MLFYFKNIIRLSRELFHGLSYLDFFFCSILRLFFILFFYTFGNLFIALHCCLSYIQNLLRLWLFLETPANGWFIYDLFTFCEFCISLLVYSLCLFSYLNSIVCVIFITSFFSSACNPCCKYITCFSSPSKYQFLTYFNYVSILLF